MLELVSEVAVRGSDVTGLFAVGCDGTDLAFELGGCVVGGVDDSSRSASGGLYVAEPAEGGEQEGSEQPGPGDVGQRSDKVLGVLHERPTGRLIGRRIGGCWRCRGGRLNQGGGRWRGLDDRRRGGRLFAGCRLRCWGGAYRCRCWIGDDLIAV